MAIVDHEEVKKKPTTTRIRGDSCTGTHKSDKHVASLVYQGFDSSLASRKGESALGMFTGRATREDKKKMNFSSSLGTPDRLSVESIHGFVTRCR